MTEGVGTLPRLHFNTFPARWVEWDVIIFTAVFYVTMALGLRHFMKDRAPVSMDNPALKYSMLLYNWTQVIVSVTMTYQLGKLIALPNIFGLQHEWSAHAEYWIFIHYLSKSLDFFDTVFICLKKKDRQFSFLHVYHHATIGGIWGWLLQVGYGNGTAFYGAWINSLVHSVMYFHYGWTALGLDNPFKSMITKFQIAQFYSCIAHSVFVFIWDRYPNGHWPIGVILVQTFYHFTMIILFTGFFQATYKSSKKLLSSLPAEDITSLEKPKGGKLE